MEKRSLIPKSIFVCSVVRCFAWTRRTQSGSINKKARSRSPVLFDWTYLENLCGCRGLKQRYHRHPLNVGRSDTFEVRADAAKFGVHKRIDEVQVAIEPGEHSVLNAVMDRKCNLGAGRPD